MRRSFKRWTLAILVALMVLAPTSALAAADSGRHSDAVMLTGRIHVDEDESLGTVVAFDGPAVIDGSVENVIAFNGNVTVTGTVDDTVLAFNGRAIITDGAVVNGDVYSRYAPRIDPGADVGGSTGRFDPAWFEAPFALVSRIAFWLAVSVSTLALGLILVAFGPKAAEAAGAVARNGTGAAIGIGLGLFFGLPLFAVFAMITVVGIPLGVGLLFALALIYAVGYVVSAWLLGRSLVAAPHRRALAFLAGWAILRAVALIPFVGGLVWFGAVVFGLGVLVVEAWRARVPPPAKAPAVTGPAPA